MDAIAGLFGMTLSLFLATLWPMVFLLLVVWFVRWLMRTAEEISTSLRVIAQRLTAISDRLDDLSSAGRF